jgi:ankyrin repeat protein
LNGACFHGHWQLCQFLVERGADVNLPLEDSGETPLHAAICTSRPVFNYVVKVLLANGANPNAVTKPGAETGGFMRDCRTKGETPLHRAAAFANEEMIQMLLDAGASREARDMHGDSPLGWASWYLRPASILRKLCFGNFRIRPEYAGMETHLRGKVHT